jgi:hypothetical protein
MSKIKQGSCHCGSAKFEVELENVSIGNGASQSLIDTHE